MRTRKTATAEEIRLLVIEQLAGRGVPAQVLDLLPLVIERKQRARADECNWTFAVDDGPLPAGLEGSVFAYAITKVQLECQLG